MRIIVLIIFLNISMSQQRISIDEAISYGIDNNFQQKLSQLDLEFFDEQILQGYMNFAPSLSFNSSYVTFSDFSLLQQKAQVDGFKALLASVDPTLADRIPNTAFKNVHRTDLSLQWNLFAKGQALKALSEMKSQKEIQVITNKQTHLETIYKVREAFYDLYIAEQFQTIAALRVKTMKNRVSQVENLVEKGFRNESELLRWKIELSKAEDAKLDADIMQQNAQKQFAFTIGAPMSTVYIPVMSQDFQENIFTDLNDDLITNLNIADIFDIQKVQIQKQIAEDNQFYTYGKFLPSVDLNWRKTWQQSNNFMPAQQPWELSLNFSWELFSSFKDYLELEKNEIDIQRGQLRKRDMERQIEMSIQQLYLNLDKSRKQLKTAKYAIELSKENYRIQKNRYEKGLTTNLDLLDSEIQLYQSNLDALQIYKSYVLSGYSLKKLIGHIN